MIHDVDESLRMLLRREAGLTNDIEIAFDAPTKDWASRRNTPTIDLYLYDIRESLERRKVLYDEERDAEGKVARRVPFPRWFRLSYLITAWTQRTEDEHRLLSAILFLFIRHLTFPRELLAGAISEIPHHVTIDIARPPPQDRAISDIWSALGGELKPSLDLVLTVPFLPEMDYPMGPAVLEAPAIRIADGDGRIELPMSRRTRKGVAAAAEAAGTDIARRAGQRRGQFAPLGIDAWAARDSASGRGGAGGPGSGGGAGADGEDGFESDEITLTGKSVKVKSEGGDEAGETEREPTTEEASGGNASMPGRRFRFSVIEPGKKPK